MVAQQDSKHKKLVIKPNKNAKLAIVKNKIDSKIADNSAKRSRQGAKLKSGKPPAKAEKVLKIAKGKIKNERRARVKMVEARIKEREDLTVERQKGEPERQRKVRRISFVVRLTVGAGGLFQRTEIEHVSSNKKQNFLSLDGEQLTAFMMACISPATIPEPAPSPLFPKAEILDPERLEPKFGLVITSVGIFPLINPNSMTLTLMPDQPFIVQARFHLQGTEVLFLPTQEPSYIMKVCANEVTSGRTKLLTTHRAKLLQNLTEYEVREDVPGLPSGIYRMFTLITIRFPTKMAGYYDRTIIHVI